MRTLVALLLAAVSMPPVAAAFTCDVESGTTTAALVELYTSEGCSSCPPADLRLSRIPGMESGAAKAVPIALHVDYWDYIGWKDAYALAAFGERQRWLVHANHGSTSYTPQFFVSGMAVEDWRKNLAAEIRRINLRTAQANIHLRVGDARPGRLSLDADARSPLASAPLALFLAVTESGLVSQIRAGENAGTSLRHDHVVREWIGPIALANGSVTIRKEVALQSGSRGKIAVIAFVQDMVTGEVLQSVSTGNCAAASVAPK